MNTAVQSSNQPEQLVAKAPASILRLLLPLATFKWWIIAISIGGGVLGYAVSYLNPKTYNSSIRLLPPQTNSMTASVLLNQVGGATALGSSALGIKNPGDLYAGILRSRAILKPVITSLELVEGYKSKSYDKAEAKLLKSLKITSGKDGILEVEVTDTDPVRAANIGNSMVASLYELAKKLTLQELHRREEFHDRLIAKARAKLAGIETELALLEQATGISRVKGQEEAISAAAAEIQGLIVTKQLEINAMQRYATPQNSELIQANKQLNLLRSQLASIKKDPSTLLGLAQNPVDEKRRNLLSSNDQINRLKRDIKLQEAVLETAVRVAEAARVDEQRDLSVIQVLDVAEPADVHSGPNRMLSAILGLMAAAILAVLVVLARDAIYSDSGRRERWNAVKSGLLKGLRWSNRRKKGMTQ
jgi:tyrosine-protein kinase Etk/Wzc